MRFQSSKLYFTNPPNHLQIQSQLTPTLAFDTENAMTKSESSRINGAKSKGPKTEQGRATSSRNALKHGCYAKNFLLLDGESVEEYESIKSQYMEIYQPRNLEETDLVLDIVNARWRVRRAENDYARLIEMEQDNPENNWDETWSELLPNERSALAVDVNARQRANTMLLLHRTENACHRIIFKTMKTLRDLRKPSREPKILRNEPEKSPENQTPTDREPARKSVPGLHPDEDPSPSQRPDGLGCSPVSQTPQEPHTPLPTPVLNLITVLAPLRKIFTVAQLFLRIIRPSRH